MKKAIVAISILWTLSIGPVGAEAQYFGRNKVQYETFDFKVLETEHFDIYYYDREAEAIEMVARMAERWYFRLSNALRHTMQERQPLIIYASHPEFRQTNAVPGEIGEATGGVTEALKRRVVLPLAGPLAETDHVLGHELVHAFQFDITSQGSNAIGFTLPGALRLPLWFMEGMAEYLSIGPVDPHTAMWLRDALIHDDLPTVQDLDHPRYFPYRFGHAFWSYVAGRWGDETIGFMLKAAGRTGSPEDAIVSILGISSEELSEEWHAAIRADYDPILAATAPAETVGARIPTSDAGSLNLSPALSPDGRHVVFLSERDLFSIDMYLAEVDSGRIVRKITDTALDPHIESLQFVSSSGAWSMDGREFVYGAIVDGRPELRIIEPESGRRVRHIPFPELGEIFNPAWSPDGARIVFSAIAGGLTDLYVVDVETGAEQRLTEDVYTELHPAWSPDGGSIAFVTDRFTTDLNALSFGGYRIALYDVASGVIRPLAGAPEGRQTNPQWSPDGARIYFLGDAGGIANLHRVDVQSGQAETLTNVQGGVSGITPLSPALSVASSAGTIVAGLFREGGYDLFAVQAPPVPPGPVPDALRPAALPPRARELGFVAEYMADPADGLPAAAPPVVRDYRPRISLDYIAQPSVTVGVSSYGSFAGGGIAFVWSDMLGDHTIETTLQLNMETTNFVRNFSGLVGYENRRHRWSWGGVAGQVPLISGSFRRGTAVVDGQLVLIEEDVRFWEIHRQAVGVLTYPLSRAQRVEFSGGFRNISFVSEQVSRVFLVQTGQEISREIVELPAPERARMGVAGAALVYDTSIFGGIGPVRGQRYRFEASSAAGDLRYQTALLDYRRYEMPVRPLTIAGRLLHFGRYGREAEDSRLQPLFLGYDHLVRGYDLYSFSAAECGPVAETCPVFDALVGSRVGIANLEVRLPLLGPLGVFGGRSFIPVEVALFGDGGTAWTRDERPDWAGGERQTVTSYGLSFRANLLGFVGQMTLVHPNNRPLRNWMWQFSLNPGF